MGPDSWLVRSVLWLLFQAPVFSPHRDVISEAAYNRALGAKKWPWCTDASFRTIHNTTQEDIRAAHDPLGRWGVATVWLLLLAGVGLAAKGVIMDNNLLYLSFLALSALPLVLAVRRVCAARSAAKTEMVRCAFELERQARQSDTPSESQRAAIVAHHCVLAYLEEVLESCMHGGRPTPIPMQNLRAYQNKMRMHNAPKVTGQSSIGLQGDVESLNMVPKDDMLMSAAGGLRGVTARGGLQLSATQPAFCYQCNKLLTFPTMRVSGRLKRVPEFCQYMVEVVLYKYGWQRDDQLRKAAVQAAEAKLLEGSRTGRFCLFYFCSVAALNVLLIGAAVALLAFSGDWRVWAPPLAVVVLVLIASLVMLSQQLPVWSIVDGVRASARRRVDTGDAAGEVGAATDVAVRALGESLRAFNDNGELQSCAFWRALVPRRAGEVTSASGGLYEVLGDGVSGRMGPAEAALSGPMSDRGSTRWQPLPSPRPPSEAAQSAGLSAGPGTGHGASNSARQHSSLTLPTDPPIPLLLGPMNHQDQQQQAADGDSARSGGGIASPVKSPVDHAMHAVATLAAGVHQHENCQLTGSAAAPQAGVELAGGALETQQSDVSTVMGQEPTLVVDSFAVEGCLRGIAAARPGSRAGSRAGSLLNSMSEAVEEPSALNSFAFQRGLTVEGEMQELFGGEIASCSPKASTSHVSESNSRDVTASHLCAVPSGAMSPVSTPIHNDAAAPDAAAGGSGPKFLESPAGGGFLIDLVDTDQPRFDAPTTTGGGTAAGVFPARAAVSDDVKQTQNDRQGATGSNANTAKDGQDGGGLAGSPGYVHVSDGFLITLREPEGGGRRPEQQTLDQLKRSQVGGPDNAANANAKAARSAGGPCISRIPGPPTNNSAAQASATVVGSDSFYDSLEFTLPDTAEVGSLPRPRVAAQSASKPGAPAATPASTSPAAAGRSGDHRAHPTPVPQASLNAKHAQAPGRSPGAPPLESIGELQNSHAPSRVSSEQQAGASGRSIGYENRDASTPLARGESSEGTSLSEYFPSHAGTTDLLGAPTRGFLAHSSRSDALHAPKSPAVPGLGGSAAAAAVCGTQGGIGATPERRNTGAGAGLVSFPVEPSQASLLSDSLIPSSGAFSSPGVAINPALQPPLPAAAASSVVGAETHAQRLQFPSGADAPAEGGCALPQNNPFAGAVPGNCAAQCVVKGGLNVDTHQAHGVPARPMLPMLPEVPEVGAVDSRYTSSSLTTTVPGASFMVGDLINLTDSQMESQFSTGAEGVDALFSTLEGGTNLPLPPSFFPNPVMPGDDIMRPPGRKRHMFQAGNPLFQEEDARVQAFVGYPLLILKLTYYDGGEKRVNWARWPSFERAAAHGLLHALLESDSSTSNPENCW